jgi:hydrogenase maturation protease
MATGDLIVGIGSPHGDDAVGWTAVRRLAQRVDATVRLVTLREPVELMSHLDGCRRLWIVDACRSASPVGSVHRLSWPDERVDLVSPPSSHALGIAAALQLAEALDRLPEQVVVFAVEAAESQSGVPQGSVRNAGAPIAGVSAEVEAALSTLEQRLIAEVEIRPVEMSG